MQKPVGKARVARNRTISDADDSEIPELSPVTKSYIASATAEDAEAAEDALLCCKILSLCLCWYTVSSANGIVGKQLLSNYPYPATATLAQLLCTAIFSQPLAMHWRVPEASWDCLGWQYGMKMVMPLAVGKFVAAVSAHVSLWKVPVSYAHTVKASMPIFVVLLSRVLLGETQTLLVYASLLPIVIGVVIATLTEVSFDMIGLISALLATLAFSLQNVFSKKCLKETGMHHIRLLVILARIATIMFLPVWLFSESAQLISDWFGLISTQGHYWFMLLLTLDGMLNFSQNVIAFTMLALVTPLSYAVANASKRIAVILLSLLVLQNPVTPMNVFGMSLAIIGVLLYNKAKYEQNAAAKRKQLLPYVSSDAALMQSAAAAAAAGDTSHSNGMMVHHSQSVIIDFHSSDNDHSNYNDYHNNNRAQHRFV